MTVFRWRTKLLAAAISLAALLLGAVMSSRLSAEEAVEEEAPLDLAAIDAKIDDADREHWAFQQVVAPPAPTVRDAAWVRNPIDAFILARLEKRDWLPAPPAEPRAILRRVYLNLIGLPPTLEEQAAFLADPSPEALDRVVEDLLARPTYGERWARHWLDLARYADTNGYERDSVKPHVWRYRDWVIRALNDDKPFDRFVVEQLAGDELPDADSDTVIATGFYRLGPWDDEPADPAEDRYDQLDDIVSTTSQVFLGLTMGCARCHDHKFEPLTAHDYYRMVAIFNPLVRPQDGRTDLDAPAGTPEQVAPVVERDRRIAEIDARAAALEDELLKLFLAEGPTTLPPAAWEAFRTEREQRNAEQNELVRLHERQFALELAASFPPEKSDEVAALRDEAAALRRSIADLPRGYFFREPSPPPATHLLVRGKAARPGPEVAPGLPVVLVSSQPEFPSGEPTSLRRLTFANWIASPNNPLTARVIVNRVWQHHFGEGLVRSPSDFGVMGDAPTHPELLDWLAAWFVREGWSIKKLHRLILGSNAYRMSKAYNAEYAERDPEMRLLWRMPNRRLEVEAIRDSILASSGTLNDKRYGPPMFPFVPKEAMEGHSDPGMIWAPFDENEASRRTIYAFVRRSMIVPMIEVLDFCDTARTAPQRVTTSVAPQALALFNGHFVNRQARHLADRLLGEVGQDANRQIDLAYRLTLCRPATETECDRLSRFLDDETERQLADAAAGESLAPAQARYKALVEMCRVIFNLNEFAYAD